MSSSIQNPASSNQHQAIGIDLGGTNIKAALVDTQSAQTLATLSKPTRDGEFENNTPHFAFTVREIIQEFEAQAGSKLAVGLSAPGLANPNGQCIDWMPGRMHGLEKFDWSAFLERDCRVLNDAHAALLGEVWAGAAKNCRDVFMLTLGTGVGGAIYSGGRLLSGKIGRAGHLGHISIDTNAPRDDFNTPGSLEDAIGNQTIAQRGEGRYATTHALLDAYAAGDEHAKKIWLTSVRHLAAAIASLINVLDPELIIIGGGIAVGAGDRLFDPLATFLDDFEWRPGRNQVRVVPASLGDSAGCLGAVFNLIQSH
ncbi:ROK family protein [Prosthecobacter sp.]|uniref:ROK family protein n=1 Tax=Prosthecobacter sp. TaxID=1965333 RepID=UPI002AB9AF85|nr:ROK family protein [Prosthecobacter sp.]MDZ4405234.1 ROK family protein [Prosthecobacter sp.]